MGKQNCLYIPPPTIPVYVLRNIQTMGIISSRFYMNLQETHMKIFVDIMGQSTY